MALEQQLTSDWLRWQGQACAYLGSTLYAELLERAADDALAGGPVGVVMDSIAHLPRDSAPALRLMGAVHRLVLQGEAPSELADEFRPGGSGERAWPAFLELISDRSDVVEDLLQRPVQTNEVGRAAALAPALLWIARECGDRPLRLLELGSSAGLNLRWDHYRYGSFWGDPAAGVAVPAEWYEGELPPFEGAPEIVERRGCDADPIDPTTDEGRLTLLSYVWPDQEQRVEFLRAALDIAARVPVAVERAGAGDWIEDALAPADDDVTTVVFHSIFIQYLEEAEKTRLRAAIEGAPVVWLRLEPELELARLDVDFVGDGPVRSLTLGQAGYHGRPVRWRSR
jgi:hypothetical protein